MSAVESFKQLIQKIKGFKPRPELLLLPNIPKPLHGLAPRVVLGIHWWDNERKTAYVSTGYRCAACGRRKIELPKTHPYLEGHEVYKVEYELGRATYIETVPLCWWCHNFIHDGRLEILFNNKEISSKEFREVKAHGNAILKASRLNRKPYGVKKHGRVADWKDWRIVVNGVEYGPAFKSESEWRNHFKC